MLKRTALGFVLGFGVIRGLAGCGTPAVLQCRLDAVKVLPKDPGQLTPYDVADLVGRLHACEQQGSDAGR